MRKGYNPNQPRHPKGSEDGGEWRGSSAGPSVGQVKRSVTVDEGNPEHPDYGGKYNAAGVQQQIDRERARRGKNYISGREAKAIHSLLKGWRG